MLVIHTCPFCLLQPLILYPPSSLDYMEKIVKPENISPERKWKYSSLYDHMFCTHKQFNHLNHMKGRFSLLEKSSNTESIHTGSHYHWVLTPPQAPAERFPSIISFHLSANQGGKSYNFSLQLNTKRLCNSWTTFQYCSGHFLKAIEPSGVILLSLSYAVS